MSDLKRSANQKMVAFIAGLAGGFFGLVQLLFIFFIEEKDEDEASGFSASDPIFAVFGFLVMVEVMCVMAQSMYKISPWVAHILGDDWEARRIIGGKRKYGSILRWTTVSATLLRRIIVMIDASHFSASLGASLFIALSCLFIPKPKI